MKTNKILMTLMALFTISLLSLGTMAYMGNQNIDGPNYNAEVHEQLEDALDDRDYDLWLSIREDNNLPTRGKIFSVITEENFDMFVDLHEANQAGDVDSANSIKAELGLGQGMMNRGNDKGIQGQENSINRNRENFVDADNDGSCDNLIIGKGRR